MNLTLILAFHKVASAGGFTAAATASGVSQPTLSAQVKKLEATIGSALFERTGRRIRLTPLGVTLHEATQRLSTAIGEVEALVQGTRSESRGRLSVMADSAIHVLPVLARLKQRAGGFNFSLRISNSADVIAEVLAKRVDVGITARATTDSRLHAIRIRDDRLVMLVGSGETLSARRRIRLVELAGRDLVMREKGSITREVAERALAETRMRKGQVFEVATRDAVREAVAAGFGYGLVFASEAGRDERVATLQITDADVSVAEFAICRSEQRRSGLVARFFEMAAEVAADNDWLARPPRPSVRSI